MEMLTYALTCMKLKDIILSEISQSHTHTQNTTWFHLYEISTVLKFIETKK